MSDEKTVRNARLKLALLALIFFGPLALAWALYYGFPGATPSGARTNAGVLIDPARPLPELDLVAGGGTAGGDVFREQWTLLTVAPEGCGDACRERLADTRQVRALMHRRSTRVQRVLVSAEAGDAALREGGHPDLRVFRGGIGLYEFLSAPDGTAAGPGVIYLIDPLGNWVLYYPAGTAPKAVFEDLKHLLKLSHIG